MRQRFPRLAFSIPCIMAVMAIAFARPLPANVILQYFEGRWQTMERRMPDIFMAGYDAIWIPPTGVADSGGYSVGYDVFDRFNLGSPFWQSLYGTEESLVDMISQANRAGILVYPDIILNHNGFRDSSTPGFVDSGDYPGMVTYLDGVVDGDFHSSFAGGDWDGRLAGLIDIDQTTNNSFIRHPVTPGDPLNIPNEPALESNRRFYPDTDFNSPASLGDTSGDRHSPAGFNLDNPMAGDPYPENVNSHLQRYVRWMVDVIGADGFRLDAVKHVPQWFWNDIYDPSVFELLPGPNTPFSFGEVFDGDFGVLSSYTRKDGYGNRDVLDFPLYFRMQDVLNGSGFGDMRQLEYASFDGSDGDANDGSRGVQFVSSHDKGPPGADNIGYAHILTRPGYPLVYFNAHEFGDGRDFPVSGRGDALGGEFGSLITEMVGIHRDMLRGGSRPHRTRWIDDDVYIYERSNVAVIGLNDNGASDQMRSVSNLDLRNVTLVELTGNPGASPTVNVDGSGNATFTIPSNGSGLGFAIWGLQRPQGSTLVEPFALSPVSTVLPADPPETPNATRRITPIDVVTTDSVTVTLTLENEGLDDNALIRVNDGSLDVIGTGIIGSGDFGAFQNYQNASPSATGGDGTYSATLDTAQMPDGYNYLESVAFLQRDSGPYVTTSFRRVLYLDRTAPDVDLLYPGQTGSGDVQSSEYEVVLENPDATADSMHVLVDFVGTDEEARAAVSGATQANRVDRSQFRFNWTGITAGTHSLTVIAFEPTGNSSVTRFENIDASIAVPDASFANLPATIDASTYDDIQVRVNFNNPFGGDDYVFDPTEVAANSFNVQLSVDGEVFPAMAYAPGLVGSTNTLYQNDDDLGDEVDVFRFNWREFDTGFHQFTASAELNDHSEPAAVVSRSVEVLSTAAGPIFDIASPAPPASPSDPPTMLLVDPNQISVTLTNVESTARSVRVFVQSGESESLLATQNVDGSLSTVIVSGAPASGSLYNGTATLRVDVSTAPNGGGVLSEKSTRILILGVQDQEAPPKSVVIDGQANEWVGTPPSDVHDTTVDNGEWIYRGESADARTDFTDTSNFDLTELRVLPGEDDLFFLARFDDITNVRIASFALAIDTQEPGDSTGVNFIGDQSGTYLDTSSNTWDFTVQVHFVDADFSQVEVFDDVGDLTWFAPLGEQSYISNGNDLIEFSIPRDALGLTAEEMRTISIQGATFNNALTDGAGQYNNDADTTVEIGDAEFPDALDVLGGEVGVSDNAWGRAFSEGAGSDNVLDSTDNANVVLIYDIDIPAPSLSGLVPLPLVQSVVPASGEMLADTTPIPVTFETNTVATSALLAVNGQIIVASEAGIVGEVRTWTANASNLQEGANVVYAVAFENNNYTGLTGLAQVAYLVSDLIPSVEQIIDHILGVTPLVGDDFNDANLQDSDSEINAADLVLRVEMEP